MHFTLCEIEYRTLTFCAERPDPIIKPCKALTTTGAIRVLKRRLRLSDTETLGLLQFRVTHHGCLTLWSTIFHISTKKGS